VQKKPSESEQIKQMAEQGRSAGLAAAAARSPTTTKSPTTETKSPTTKSPITESPTVEAWETEEEVTLAVFMVEGDRKKWILSGTPPPPP
jgi:hypothetical protein